MHAFLEELISGLIENMPQRSVQGEFEMHMFTNYFNKTDGICYRDSERAKNQNIFS